MELALGELPENKQDPEQLFIESRVEEGQFATFMPKKGFIAEYMKYTSISEAPGSFHFWTAISVLSAVLGRNTWMVKGIYRVYPNMFIVLVAPSGKCRKTGAIRTGVDLAQKMQNLNIIADKTTPEAFLEALMKGPITFEEEDDPLGGGGTVSGLNLNIDSTGYIRSTEMSTFLNKATYSSGMITILTDLYDCPDEFKYLTRNKKPIILNNVAVTMIAGTTPEWLATNLPEAAFEGGFMSRVIWVVKHWRDRIIPLEDEPDPAEMDKLVKMLNLIHKQHTGPMTFTQDAKTWYIDWYSKNAMKTGDNEKLSGFNERLPDTMIKLAMLLQAAEQPGNMALELSYLQTAERIMRWQTEKMFRAFEDTELSRMGQLRRQINQILDHYGEVSQRDVMRKIAGRLDYKQQFEDVRQVMEDSGELIVETVHTGNKGRPRIVWRRPLQDEQ
jgi:hypothetical protein